MFGDGSSWLQNDPDTDGGAFGCPLGRSRGLTLSGPPFGHPFGCGSFHGAELWAQGWPVWSLHFLLPDGTLGLGPSVPCPRDPDPASRSQVGSSPGPPA